MEGHWQNFMQGAGMVCIVLFVTGTVYRVPVTGWPPEIFYMFRSFGGIRDSVDVIVTRPGVHKFPRNLRVTSKFEAQDDMNHIPCWGNANIRRYRIKFKSPRPLGFRVISTAGLGYWLNAGEIVSRFPAWANRFISSRVAWPANRQACKVTEDLNLQQYRFENCETRNT